MEIGLNFTAGTYGVESTFIPPDTMGAVGEEHIVEFINGAFLVYRKSDGTLVQWYDSIQFWTLAGKPPRGIASFDPRILYDPLSRRWFALEVDGGASIPRTNRFLVAVSNSSDPTQGWTAFRILSDSWRETWADFPRLGINADAVYLAANMFHGCCFYSGFVNLVILPKVDLLAPTPSIANRTVFEGVHWSQGGGFSSHPVVDLDDSGLPASFLAYDYGLRRLIVGGEPNAPFLEDPIDLPVFHVWWPPNADQPGPKANLETAGDITANPVLRNGTIWLALNAGSPSGHAAVRWYQIDAETNTVLQEGWIADPELDLYYPSIAVNEFDEVVVGFTGSSETQFPSAYAAIGQTSEGQTIFSDPILLRAGVASYERLSGGRNRWGDYSATVVDPVDSRTFWTFQEFVVAEDTWATQITELRVNAAMPIDVDIKPGSCPNAYNRSSNGVLPVAVVGAEGFDVTQIDLGSVTLWRADGVGGSVGPNQGPGPQPAFEDIAAPAVGEVCECDEASGDGILDLSLKFRTEEVVEALLLNDLPAGDLPELVVSGVLTDGTPFEGSDCVRLVPPGTSSSHLTLGGNMTGAWIDASPLDETLDGGGFVSFERSYPQTTEVTLTASAWHNGRGFKGWRLNGGALVREPALGLVIDEPVAVEAVYRSGGCGLGMELVLLLVPVRWLHRRRRLRWS